VEIECCSGDTGSVSLDQPIDHLTSGPDRLLSQFHAKSSVGMFFLFAFVWIRPRGRQTPRRARAARAASRHARLR
jgi:hypothetical protein